MAIAGALVIVLAASFLADGFYLYDRWAPFALVVFALTVALVAVELPPLSRSAAVAMGSLVFLLLWSGLSLTWAESVDRAWTEVDRLALYTALFFIGLVLADRRRARAVVIGIALGVTIAAAYITVRMLAGSGGWLFLNFRLHEPVGYANGQAGLFLMGFWCLIAIAEQSRSHFIGGLACAVAALLGDMLVLTQSRALSPALLIVAAMVLFLPGRVPRAALLLVVATAVAAALPATLDVYAEKAIDPTGSPTDGVLRSAAVFSLVLAAASGVIWALARHAAARPGASRYRRPLATILVLIPVAVAAAGVIAVHDPVGGVERQWKAFKELDPSVYASASPRFTNAGGFRFDIWRIALNQFADHPLTGLGAGNYVETYYRERRSDNNVRQPHSLELQFLAELGAPGGIALVAFVVAVLFGAFRPPPRAVTHRLAIRVAALGVFATWFVHTSVDWLYNIPGVTAAALLCAGLLVGQRTDWEGQSVRTARHSRAALLGVIVLVGVVAAGVGRHYGATLYRERAEASLPGDPAAALADTRRSLTLNPYDIATYITASAAHARRHEYDLARQALLAASRREPFNDVPWGLLGDLATRRGDRVQARADYARARALNPRAYLAGNHDVPNSP